MEVIKLNLFICLHKQNFKFQTTKKKKIKKQLILFLKQTKPAGKSTLINLLTGLLQPTRGDAYFFGYSLVSF